MICYDMLVEPLYLWAPNVSIYLLNSSYAADCEPVETRSHPHSVFKVHFKNVFPSVLRFSRCLFPSFFPYTNLRLYNNTFACYIAYQSRFPCSEYLNNTIIWPVQILKFFVLYLLCSAVTHALCVQTIMSNTPELCSVFTVRCVPSFEPPQNSG
jgi:hypothetical protein